MKGGEGRFSSVGCPPVGSEVGESMTPRIELEVFGICLQSALADSRPFAKNANG